MRQTTFKTEGLRQVFGVVVKTPTFFWSPAMAPAQAPCQCRNQETANGILNYWLSVFMRGLDQISASKDPAIVVNQKLWNISGSNSLFKKSIIHTQEAKESSKSVAFYFFLLSWPTVRRDTVPSQNMSCTNLNILTLTIFDGD